MGKTGYQLSYSKYFTIRSDKLKYPQPKISNFGQILVYSTARFGLVQPGYTRVFGCHGVLPDRSSTRHAQQDHLKIHPNSLTRFDTKYGSPVSRQNIYSHKSTRLLVRPGLRCVEDLRKILIKTKAPHSLTFLKWLVVITILCRWTPVITVHIRSSAPFTRASSNEYGRTIYWNDPKPLSKVDGAASLQDPDQ